MSEPWNDYAALAEDGPWSDYAATTKPVKPKPKSMALGLFKGVMKPLDNAALALESGAQAIGIPTEKVNNLFRTPSASEAMDTRRRAIEASPSRPAPSGEVIGNIVGTIPAMMATKNPFIAGGIQGAALTDKRDLVGVGMDAGAGAVLNWAGGKAVDAVADVIKPVIDPAVQRLKDAGVRLTPGMVKGGKAMVKEDKAMSRPFVGDAIRTGRQATQETFNTAGVNKVLAPLGVKVPSAVKPGNDSIDYAKTQISRAYDTVIPNLSLSLDPQAFAARVGKEVSILEAPQRKQFQNLVNRLLVQTKKVNGQGIKDAQGELRRLAASYSRSQVVAERELGRALRGADEELTAQLMAQNPKYAPQLQKVNEAYRGYRIVADAAGRADDGLFNTGQLKQSVRRGDFTKNKDAAARGNAFFQEFSNDARNVIPAKTPNSGTADRLQSQNLFANLGGQVERGAFALDDLYQQSRFIPRPRGAATAANVVRRLRGPAGAAAIAGTQPLRD
jgi:hypothetical protein